MALITCPHCGNQVSDTVERCIHCGELIKEKPPEPKRYADLSMAEKDSLDSEFERNHPGYSIRKVEKRRVRHGVAMLLALLLSWLIVVILLIGALVHEDRFYETHGIHLQGQYDSSDFTDKEMKEMLEENGGTIVWSYRGDETIILSGKEYRQEEMLQRAVIVVSVFLIIIGVVITLVEIVKFIKANRNVLLAKKLFQAWLVQKNVIYEPRLTSKEKLKFDSLDITKYRI